MMIYRTFTNKILDIQNITPEDIDIRDIAWSLSRQIRYAGHILVDYTIADHSIYMAKHFIAKGEFKNALHALLHDATEAYISDIPSPVKQAVPAIREFENTIYDVIAVKFGLEKELPNDVELMDKEMIPIEMGNFFEMSREYGLPDIPIYKSDGYYVFIDLYEEIVSKL